MRKKANTFPWPRPISIRSRAQTAATLSPATASGANIYNLYTAQLQVSYTFDVWGLNRRAVESLQALADVQRFEVEAAYLALTSNVVVAAITEASLRGEIEATDQLIAINSKMLDLLKRRLDTGYSNGSDVAVQEAALAQAKATLPPLRKALAQQRDLLAALSGAYAGDGPRETFRLANLHLPVDLPVSLPSQLVEQRPDVRAATEQLHAASAQIGVATANLLPNFTISANGGYSNTVFAALISPQSLAWELAGNATQTIFDAGTLLHQLEGARDTYQAAAWTYRGTVIGAVQNVADALRALQNDADALRAARDFERAAKKSSIWRSSNWKRVRPTCCCSSPRSRLICRRPSRWCRRKRRGSPTPQLYSKRSAAAGGTGSSRRWKRPSTSARAKPNRFDRTPRHNDPALPSDSLRGGGQTSNSISRAVSCDAADSLALFCSIIPSRRAMF